MRTFVFWLWLIVLLNLLAVVDSLTISDSVLFLWYIETDLSLFMKIVHVQKVGSTLSNTSRTLLGEATPFTYQFTNIGKSVTPCLTSIKYALNSCVHFDLSQIFGVFFNCIQYINFYTSQLLQQASRFFGCSPQAFSPLIAWT